VDEVTQWHDHERSRKDDLIQDKATRPSSPLVMGAVEHISEAWLEPLLLNLLEQFPFRIPGFHSDGGREFINHNVKTLLNKLLVEQAKSRPRHSNDNGQVESKNGSVIRKHMGFDHIASSHADRIGVFYREHFNP
jgi:hypothetical protein